LQELLAQIARFLKLPQWRPPEQTQRWLRLGKYASAAAVLGLAFFSLEMASTAAEVEPFKTAITSKFTRAWPYLVYAGVVLGAGLFTERAYCQYLCPLGGTLAVLDRLHVFTMLKRRQECGNPCRLCERTCPVNAIERTGKIIMSECILCLDCQVEYSDGHRCPPLVQERKDRSRERLAAMTPPAAAAAPDGAPA
jgi:polyferredoxin